MLTNQNKVLTHNDKWLEPETNAYYYNPLNLPPYTIRVVYKNGTKPVLTGQYGYWAGNNYRVNPNLVSMKQISSVPNVWDITYSTDQWIYLFYEEPNLLKVLGANTTGVTSMNGLFQNCHNLNEVALFDTSSVVDMGGMFGNTIVFSSGYYDGHSSLETIPLFDTHNVTNMSGMFDSATGLKYVPNLNTSKVTNMGRMFAFCFGLEETPLLDTKSATYIDEMFYKCKGLKKINEYTFTSVNSCNYIFSNCYNVESGMLEMYDALRNAYTGRETRVGYDHNQAFKNCGFTHKYVDGVWSKVYASEDSQYAQAHILDTWGGEMVKRHVYTTGTNGTVSAVPNYDYPETTVTLSNTPNEGYEFDSYSVTGATIYDGNKLDIGYYSDVNVHGNFNGIVRTITCTGDHGTVIATPSTGIIGDTITLSNVPASGYILDHYIVVGSTLYDTNKFDIGTSNVSVSGIFNLDMAPITIGTQTWMSKNLAIDDGGSGITKVNLVSANGVNFGTQYYYTRAAAIRIANTIPGWHLPSKEEWDALKTYLGTQTAGKQLKSTTGWNNNYNGTDIYGFNGIPVEYHNESRTDDRIIYETRTGGSIAAYWSSSVETSSTSTGYRDYWPYYQLYSSAVNKDYLGKISLSVEVWYQRNSVRLIKDS